MRARALQVRQGGEHAAVFVLEFADVGNGIARRGFAAEEELEQELVAGRIVAVRDGEPLLETSVARPG